jgi:hypothetical protein
MKRISLPVLSFPCSPRAVGQADSLGFCDTKSKKGEVQSRKNLRGQGWLLREFGREVLEKSQKVRGVSDKQVGFLSNVHPFHDAEETN